MCVLCSFAEVLLCSLFLSKKKRVFHAFSTKWCRIERLFRSCNPLTNRITRLPVCPWDFAFQLLAFSPVGPPPAHLPSFFLTSNFSSTFHILDKISSAVWLHLLVSGHYGSCQSPPLLGGVQSRPLPDSPRLSWRFSMSTVSAWLFWAALIVVIHSAWVELKCVQIAVPFTMLSKVIWISLQYFRTLQQQFGFQWEAAQGPNVDLQQSDGVSVRLSQSF